jgi:hypothetical protein
MCPILQYLVRACVMVRWTVSTPVAEATGAAERPRPGYGASLSDIYSGADISSQSSLVRTRRGGEERGDRGSDGVSDGGAGVQLAETG